MNSKQVKSRQQASLRGIRTAISAHVRSKPTAEGQRFLDLYGLQRERLRWSRMKYKAEQMIADIDKALEKIGFSPGGENQKEFGGSLEAMTTTAQAGAKKKRCA